MEDIIYTLLVIGWIVFGVIKAAKKNKKNKQPLTDAPNFNGDIMEEAQTNTPPINELISSIFNPEMVKTDQSAHPYSEETSTTSTIKPEKSTKIEDKSKLDSYSGTDHTTSVFSTKIAKSSIKTNTYEAVDNQSEDHEEYVEQEAFNLRQAIIHTVILERPY